MPFHLSGTLSVPEAGLAAARAALPEHERLTRAEPGCVKFNVSEIQPGVFSVEETFKDEAAFAAHRERARNTTWAAAAANAVRDYRTWQD